MGKLTLLLLATPVLTLLLVVMKFLDPRGGIAGLLFGGSLGLALFITGPVWLARRVSANMQNHATAAASSAPSKEIEILTAGEIVDLVDGAVNKVVQVANHPWLAQHWHKLNAVEKMKWVDDRREYLNVELRSARMPMEFVTALQKSDKDFALKAA